MSLFDPLYRVDSDVAPSLDIITTTLQDFDGGGSGLMSARQMLAACKAIENLGFTENELKNYVKEGLDVAGDGNGKIKLSQFASYIAFEASKMYKKKKNNQPQQQKKSSPSDEKGYDNPFADFMSDPKPQQPTSNGFKLSITPDPLSPVDPNEQPMDMSDVLSPTTQNPQEMPDWFGHSLDTIVNHPSRPSAIINKNDPFDAFGIFDDDKKQQNNGKLNKPYKPMHTSVATQDLVFDDDILTPTSPNTNNDHETVSKSPNLSPIQAKKMKSKHQSAKSTGLIAPPRSKKDKNGSVSSPKSPKENGKKRKSKKSAHEKAASLEFAQDDTEYVSKKRKKERMRKAKSAKNTLKLNKFSKSTAVTAEEQKKINRRRNKIDAIVEMKRGAAMLKYGRRGFPHFRRFQISHDLTKLLWYSRKKNLSETHVAIRDMKDILEGQETEVFKQCTQKTLEKASFSIIYGSKLKSLDVVAKSAEEAALWIKGLKGLIKANQQKKLHKVIQILVDVDYKDISKTKYRNATSDEKRKYEIQHKNRSELVNTIYNTLQQSTKIFQSLTKISNEKNVRNSNEYNNVSVLTSEIESRLEEIEYGLTNKTADLSDLKRDVWVLKVDVTVLEEKVKVLAKIKTKIPI